MYDLAEKIAQADALEIEKLLKAVLQRYAVLYPDWEISILSLEKGSNKNEQLDRMIAMLQKMKAIS